MYNPLPGLGKSSGSSLRGEREWGALLVLTVCWVIMLVLIDPRGNFPLNDDWAYGRAVKTLVESTRLELPTQWASMTLVGHVAWGYAVTSLFGFSFWVLRAGSLLIGLIGLFGFYRFLRELNVSQAVGLVGAASVAVNPLYVQLAASYMTDVPFLVLTIWAIVFLWRGEMLDSRRDLWIGILLCLLATTIRQTGLFLPLAWSAVHVMRHGVAPKHLALPGAALALHTAYLTVHGFWLGPVAGSADLHRSLWEYTRELVSQGWWREMRVIAARTEGTLVLVGAMTFPIWVMFLPERFHTYRRSRGRATLFAALSGFTCALILLREPAKRLPGNVLYDLGVGPASLTELGSRQFSDLPYGPLWWWTILAVIAVVGAGLIGEELIHRLRRRVDTVTPWLAFWSLMHFGLIVIVIFFDRYTLIFLPLILVLAVGAKEVSPRRLLLSGVVLLGCAAFSTAGVHDYFAWNRARWKALDHLTQAEGISVERIDGGFEFNAWYLYDSNYVRQPGKSQWWIKDDEYALAFGTIPGYRVVTLYPYRAWLPPGRRAVYVLRREQNNLREGL